MNPILNKSPPNINDVSIEPDIGPQSLDRASKNSSLSRVDELLEEDVMSDNMEY